MSFLTSLVALWKEHPGTYKVEEAEDDLVPALGQMCIRSLAADLRDSPESAALRVMKRRLDGELNEPDRAAKSPRVCDVLNKIVHGHPERVVVRQDGVIELHFVNAKPDARYPWSDLWVSAQAMVDVLDEGLYKHRPKAVVREAGITKLIRDLGEYRFLPTPV